MHMARAQALSSVRSLLAISATCTLLSACAYPFTDCPLPRDFNDSLVIEVLNQSGSQYSSNVAGRQHRAYRPSGTPRAQLVVHLPGHGNEPGNQTMLVKTAAFAGYRAIGLVWTNDTLVSEDCAGEVNDTAFNDCLESTRNERGFGTSPGSVQHELVDLLAALDADHPSDGWGAYLVAGVPDWSRIILDGYSEGGNQAAYMAKQVAFYNVILISGGGNFGIRPPNASGDPVADWMTQPGATLGGRHYAIYNVGEPFASDYATAYDVLGIPTSVFLRVPEDQGAGWPDFDKTSRLKVYALTSPTSSPYPKCDPHGTTVPDSCLDYGLGESTYDLMKAHLFLYCMAGVH
jgi:hypothetical protein